MNKINRSFQKTISVTIVLAVSLIFFSQLAGAADSNVLLLDDFRKIVATETDTNIDKAKSISDDVVAVSRALSTDKAFAEAVFKAITQNNPAQIQVLLKSKARASNITVDFLEPDFRLSLKFTDDAGNIKFALCLTGRFNPEKCPDGTNADIIIDIK